MKPYHRAAIIAILLLFVNLSFAKSQTAKLEPTERLVVVAQMLSFQDFPKVQDILAIAKIESRYNEKARNGVSRGIMQVNHGPWGLDENVQAGVKLLREYYEKLGSVKAAVMAYNIGIGNYLKGKRNQHYFLKYQGAKNEILEKHSGILRRVVGGNTPNDIISSSIGLFGLTGGVLLVSDPETSAGEISRWKNSASNFGNEASGEIPSGLGEIKKEDP